MGKNATRRRAPRRVSFADLLERAIAYVVPPIDRTPRRSRLDLDNTSARNVAEEA